MDKTLEFPDLLRLIDDRSSAFRAAIAAAPSVDVQVPTCPEWTLFDLAEHIGSRRRSWAATIAAGPDAPGRITVEGAAPKEREALLAWLAAATQEQLDALAGAGPDRGCWTFWDDDSQSPRTCAGLARHQLQELAVHTYDAQLTLGAGQPLPTEVALDGAEESLFTLISTTTTPWPHQPVALDFHATEGRSWRLSLSAAGAHTTRLTTDEGQGAADASVTGTASDLVLMWYSRVELESLKLDGDTSQFELLEAWDPGA